MKVVNIVFDAYYPPVTATAPTPALAEAAKAAREQETLLEIARASLRADAVLRKMEQDVLAQRRLRARPERFRGDGI